jgi:hypothetical protein
MNRVHNWAQTSAVGCYVGGNCFCGDCVPWENRDVIRIDDRTDTCAIACYVGSDSSRYDCVFWKNRDII